MAKNKFEIKGEVINVKSFKSEKDDIPRLNVTIKTRDNQQDKGGQYVQVVITGQDKISVFQAVNDQLENNEDISIKGRAHFYNYTKDGVEHFNLSLLANDFKIADENDLSNNINISGNLGNNGIKILNNKSGGQFGAFQMAHNDFYDGKQQPPNWLNIVIPENVLESVDTDSIKAGKPVEINAKYQQRSYQNKNEQKVYTLSLVASKVELKNILESKKEQEKEQEKTIKNHNQNIR